MARPDTGYQFIYLLYLSMVKESVSNKVNWKHFCSSEKKKADKTRFGPELTEVESQCLSRQYYVWEHHRVLNETIILFGLAVYNSQLFGQNERRKWTFRIFLPEKKKEKRGGHMIKCLLTELGRAGRENIWPFVMAHRPRCARSVSHDLGPNIFPCGPPTQSIST